jgi:type IV pilus assembly protein PilW
MMLRLHFNPESRGFTLVELLIAMLLASLVGMAAYTVFSTSSRSYVSQEDVTEVQQNIRVAMERLSKDVRAAGFGLPEPPFESVTIGGENHTVAVAIANNNGTNGSDTLTLLGIGREAATLRHVDPTADCNHAGNTKLCLNSVDEFNTDNKKYLSIDGIKFLKIASIDTSNNNLNLDAPLTLDTTYDTSDPAKPKPKVYLIQAVRYSINTSLEGCSTTNPCLARRDMAGNNELLATNIEDVQFAYSLNGSAGFANGTINSNDIVSLRASIVGRSRRPAEGGNVSFRPAVEDHAAGAADKYRRRVLTSVIKVRNPRVGS